MPTDLPCPQQLLLQTFALMTAWSHSACEALLGEAEAACVCPQCGAGSAVHRMEMARRIAAQLQALHEHPRLGDGLRQGLGELQAHWLRLLPRLQPAVAGSAPLH